jgi:hypothetical protein
VASGAGRSFEGSRARERGPSSPSHRPAPVGDRSNSEFRQAREVGCGGEETEVGPDTTGAAHSRTPSPVATSHQVGELAFDLWARGPVVGSPGWVSLLLASSGEGGLVHPDTNLSPDTRRGALGSQRTRGAVLGELGDPSTVSQSTDPHGDCVRTGDRVVFEVDGEAVLRKQSVSHRRWLGLIAANYQVYAVNPLAAARYRERHHVSGAKSDSGDAKVLADLVRTDRHNHRRVAGVNQQPILEHAYGITTKATVAVIVSLNEYVAELEVALSEHFDQHSSAKIIHSLPGMGTVLGARVLGEFGDDPNRYSDDKSRRNYAGTSPTTKASGKSRVVLARHSRNKRMADARDQFAFCSTNWSPGARAYYDELKARNKHHRKATRQLANRWVGILHGFLDHGTLYDETIAWGTPKKNWPLDINALRVSPT